MLLKFTSEVEITEKKGEFKLTSLFGNLTFKEPSLFFRDFFLKLVKGEEEDALVASAIENEAHDETPQFYYYLHLLKTRGLLSFSVNLEGTPLISIVPLLPPFDLVESISDIKTFKLSPFCCFRILDDVMVMETPMAACRVVLKDQMATNLVHALAKPRTIKQLCKLFPSIPTGTLREVLQVLSSAKAFSECEESDHPVLGQWEFHDLFFHSRSRAGRHGNRYGGYYPFKGKFDPLPGIKSYPSAKKISLYRPDLTRLLREDRPFTDILESRKSIRKHGAQQLHMGQLGEFLFRTARVKSSRSSDLGETSLRCFPSGGALHEIEIYPVIHSCEGLEPGLYHYDPQDHQLNKVVDKNSKTESLLLDAKRSTGSEHIPQVLFIFSSRFQRRSWKYCSIAYATTLKNVGVLMQTMYLVGTAMNLAPCAIGGGDADLFSEAIQSNYFEETSVGEFMLGSLQNK